VSLEADPYLDIDISLGKGRVQANCSAKRHPTVEIEIKKTALGRKEPLFLGTDLAALTVQAAQ
jgi:hypothetical protein